MEKQSNEKRNIPFDEGNMKSTTRIIRCDNFDLRKRALCNRKISERIIRYDGRYFYDQMDTVCPKCKKPVKVIIELTS